MRVRLFNLCAKRKKIYKYSYLRNLLKKYIGKALDASANVHFGLLGPHQCSVFL